MSKDTIYRQDAIDATCKACSMEEDYHKCDGYPETSTWCDGLVALRALPSAEPRKKGKWDFIGWQMFQCSECKHTFTQEFLEGWSEYTYESLFPPFCPNCGSYNGGEQDEID